MSEYLSKAAAFAQNAAKLSKKVSEGIVENAREFGLEATSSGHYFDTSEEKMRDIKRQLDSRHDREKMDGLKRLIAMISKGRDVSEFFPDVVKNVASQNLEIRKLVYIYLLRYAEQEPDLALLSINTFQRDLTDQNQLIRAMALRVMSGIRVPVISPIVLLAIKKCMTDLSAYVRKTAAHAIPKCYSLDPSQKDALVDVITTLLNDNSPFTIGSVITAFNEVCPDRLDLIHLHYRKLCRMLIDADEWGQIAIMGLLLRYARTQFLNPNPDNNRVSQKKKSKAFYSDEDSDDSDNSLDNSYALDPDHEQLLRDSLPLLQSRNSAVVLSVAKIFYHLAPTADAYKISKPLIRLLHSHREIQYVVLANIATMATQRPYLFEPHLQQFFVRSTDAVFIRNLKMEIMTLVATESNITGILRELQ
ncbi:6772_t:CDS:2, partial [Cetraspora pellucida]